MESELESDLLWNEDHMDWRLSQCTRLRAGEWQRERGDEKQNTKDCGANVGSLVPLLHTWDTLEFEEPAASSCWS